jgi:hypothetical protein
MRCWQWCGHGSHTGRGAAGGHIGSCCGGRRVEGGGLTLCHRVVQLDLLEVVAYGVEGGERLLLLDEDLHVIEPLIQALYKVKNEVTIGDSLT